MFATAAVIVPPPGRARSGYGIVTPLAGGPIPGRTAELAVRVVAPAEDRVVRVQGARVLPADVHRLEGSRRGRALAVLVVTPAGECVVAPDAAGGFLAGADGLERSGGRVVLAEVVQPPQMTRSSCQSRRTYKRQPPM